jgi:hypothetical protein
MRADNTGLGFRERDHSFPGINKRSLFVELDLAFDGVVGRVEIITGNEGSGPVDH